MQKQGSCASCTKSSLTELFLPACTAGECSNSSTMSMFKVNVIARNPKREELATKPLEELVDTGSELTWLPADVLKGAGITPRRKRIFATVAQQKIKREIGYAILSAEGYETNDEVVFAESGERTARRENFGGLCGYGGKHRPSFVATTTMVAVAGQGYSSEPQASLSFPRADTISRL